MRLRFQSLSRSPLRDCRRELCAPNCRKAPCLSLRSLTSRRQHLRRTCLFRQTSMRTQQSCNASPYLHACIRESSNTPSRRSISPLRLPRQQPRPLALQNRSAQCIKPRKIHPKSWRRTRDPLLLPTACRRRGRRARRVSKNSLPFCGQRTFLRLSDFGRFPQGAPADRE